MTSKLDGSCMMCSLSVNGQQHFELSAGPTDPAVANTETEQASGHPPSTYKTPSIPKKISKLLQNNQSSTPKLETVKPSKPETVKEQIKNAFGFDDTGKCILNISTITYRFLSVVYHDDFKGRKDVLTFLTRTGKEKNQQLGLALFC